MSVVGRERELSLAEEFLDSARERFTVLALEGEAGIGKTTVWRALAADRSGGDGRLEFFATTCYRNAS